MKKILLSLLFLAFGFAQKNEITVIISNENTKLIRFEIALVKDLIQFYAKSQASKISVKYKGISTFEDNFKFLDEMDDNTFAIGAISITEERLKKYDFSQPYMVNKLSILAREDYYLKNDETPIPLGYQEGTIYENTLDQVSELFNIVPIAHKNSLTSAQSLKNYRVDLLYADFIDSWNFNLKLIRHINPKEKDEYGLMFKKGSKLRNNLDAAFTAYKKSPDYKKLIKKHFGNYSKLFFNM